MTFRASLILTICCGTLSAANAAPAPPANPEAQAAQANPIPVTTNVTTEHSAIVGGWQIRYSAVAGETLLVGQAGTPAASVYSFSYIAHDRTPARPVIFIFNGGPGSSSVWTHMGMIGPRKADLPDPIHPPTSAPFKVVDSPHSLLAVADLVFIDPVGTGFSRLLPGARPEDFLGVTQDARRYCGFHPGVAWKAWPLELAKVPSWRKLRNGAGDHDFTGAHWRCDG